MNGQAVQAGDDAAARARLEAIIREKSFRNDREFTLASGRRSTLYFNMKSTMFDAEGSGLIARLMLARLGGDADYVAGLEMGAVPLVAQLVMLSGLEGRPVGGFFVRKKPKEHGTQALIDGLGEGVSLAGKRVLVLEDVTTSGGSAVKAVAAIRDAGATVQRVLSIVDRQEGAEEAMAQAGLTLDALFRAADFTGTSPAARH